MSLQRVSRNRSVLDLLQEQMKGVRAMADAPASPLSGLLPNIGCQVFQLAVL